MQEDNYLESKIDGFTFFCVYVILKLLIFVFYSQRLSKSQYSNEIGNQLSRTVSLVDKLQ